MNGEFDRKDAKNYENLPRRALRFGKKMVGHKKHEKAQKIMEECGQKVKNRMGAGFINGFMNFCSRSVFSSATRNLRLRRVFDPLRLSVYSVCSVVKKISVSLFLRPMRSFAAKDDFVNGFSESPAFFSIRRGKL